MTLKEKMQTYRQKKEDAYNYYMNTLQYDKTYLIQGKESNMYYIISNSFYDKRIQCTCFIDDKPYNHSCHETYSDLFTFDPSIFVNGYIKEVI